jgi:hypothetical protein
MASASLQKLGVLSGVDPTLIQDDFHEYMGSGGKKRRKQKSKKRNRKSKKRNRKSIKK